jgi:K+-sensing histidine kinase KdpD
VRALLEGLLIAGLVLLAICMVAATWAWNRVRRQLRIAPRVRSKAPTVWLVSPTTAARLHRRLRSLAASARLASALDPAVTSLADDLVAEAVAIEPRLIAVATTRRAGRSVRRDLSTQVGELEAVARHLVRLSSEPGSWAEPRQATHLLERVVALEAAREELAEIDLRAGLLRQI